MFSLLEERRALLMILDCIYRITKILKGSQRCVCVFFKSLSTFMWEDLSCRAF